jgi:hypothetical protein
VLLNYLLPVFIQECLFTRKFLALLNKEPVCLNLVQNKDYLWMETNNSNLKWFNLIK